ncbi:unnamed protein product [Ceratitis capitata]|uniref:(Mediterranean fruit fly) hypothetical protein n=1 Tax=Ceratitis capitata TaxID=7213 RepID=A0A811U1S0_CERCA|nr:unnamed protein product [Ceratitis capitata]
MRIRPAETEDTSKSVPVTVLRTLLAILCPCRRRVCTLLQRRSSIVPLVGWLVSA